MEVRMNAVLLLVSCVIALTYGNRSPNDDGSACDVGCRRECDATKVAKCKLFTTGTTKSPELIQMLDRDKDKVKIKAMLDTLLRIDGFVINNDVVSCAHMLMILKYFVKKNADRTSLLEITTAAKSRDFFTIFPYIKILKMSVMTKIVTALSNEHKKKICVAVYGKSRIPCQVEYIVKKKVDCKTTLNSDNSVSDDVKEKVKEKDFKEEDKSSTQWTAAQCTQKLNDYPRQFKPKHIKHCSAESILAAKDVLIQNCRHLEPATRKFLVKKVTPLTKADMSQNNTRLMIACGAKIEAKVDDVLSNLEKEDILAMPEREVSRLLSKRKAEVTTKIADEADDKLKKLLLMLCKTRDIHELKKIPKEKQKNLMSYTKDISCPGRKPGFTASDLDTKEKVLGVKCAIREMYKDIPKIPTDKLVEALNDNLLTGCTDFKKSYCKALKVIMKKLRDASVTITADIVVNLGPLKKCIPYRDLVRRMDASALCDARIKDFFKEKVANGDPPSGAECRDIKKKISLGCRKDMKICLDPEDAAAAVVDDVAEKPVPPVKSPRAVLKRIISSLGSICEMPLQTLENMKESNLLGKANCKDLKDCNSDDVQQRCEIISQSKGGLDSKMMDCVKKKWLSVTAEEGKKPNLADIPKPLVSKLSNEERKQLRPDGADCPTATECSIYSDGAVLKTMKNKEARDKANECVKCLQSSGTLTPETLQTLGNLTCVVTRVSMARVEPDDMVVIDFDKCPASGTQDRLNQLVSKQNAINKPSADYTSYEAAAIGGLNMYRSGDLKTEVFCSAIFEVVESIKTWGSIAKERDETNPKEGSKALRGTKKEFMERAIQRYLSECQSPQARRRKRSTPSLNCDTIELFGADGVESLSATHYTTLGAQDFKDCLNTFCTTDVITDTQASAFVTRAKQEDVWGAAQNWTDDNVEAACGYAKGLSSSDIAAMNFSDTKSTLLGKLSNWTQTQLTALYQQYMTEVHSSQDSSTLESDHLLTLGHGVCGATVDEIKNMNASQIHDALPSFADDKCCLADCTYEKLAEFYKKILEIIGTDVSALTLETLEKIGTAMSGLSLADLKNLTIEQIPVIAKEAFAKMPEHFIKEMTNAQLGSMVSSQVIALTEAQMNSLSTDQYNLLAAIGGFTPRETAAGITTVGNSLMILVSTVCVLLTVN